MQKSKKFNPEGGYYTLSEKLWAHVTKRSEKAFEKAAERRAQIKTKEEFEKYVKEMREFFIESMGGIPYDSTLPLNAKTVGVIEEENLTIEKVIFEARPNVYVTANLYLPKKRKDPAPAVLFQIGHGHDGKADTQYQRVARAIASCGLIVLVMDPVGQGERFSYYEPAINTLMIPSTIWDHMYAGEACVLVGDCIVRYFIAMLCVQLIILYHVQRLTAIKSVQPAHQAVVLQPAML